MRKMSSFSGTGRSTKALITSKRENTSVVEKRRIFRGQNFDGEANRFGVVNFHCMLTSCDEHAVYFRR